MPDSTGVTMRDLEPTAGHLADCYGEPVYEIADDKPASSYIICCAEGCPCLEPAE